MNDLQSVERIFSGRLFRIPDYQRGYAWEIEQCNDLLGDMELLPEGKTHFAGTLVLCCNRVTGHTWDDEGNGYDNFDVIDGQQRLTTIVMLLDAIKDEMERIPELVRLSHGIRKNYLAVHNRAGQPVPRLRLGADNQDFFFKAVLALDGTNSIAGAEFVSQRRLQAAHDHFAAYLVREHEQREDAFGDWLEGLYIKVARHLQMLVYEVESEADAGVIFETMNDRGKPITEMDKVKNHLLYLATKLDLPDEHDLVHRVNETWSVIFRQLMSASLVHGEDEDRLLRVHWLMAYDYQIDNWEQSRSIKARFNLRDFTGAHTALLRELRTYAETLADASRAYADIYDPHRGGAFLSFAAEPALRRQVVAMSEKLRRLGQIAPFLPLLIAVRLRGDARAYLRAVTLAELFAFRVYNWLGRRSNVGQTRLIRLGYDVFSRRLSPDAALDNLQLAAAEFCPDTDFDAAFTRYAWYGWPALRYFLYEYEEYLAARMRKPVEVKWSEVTDPTKKSRTIEHVLPQHPDLEGYWAERFTPEQMVQWTHDIGNLCLTQDNSWLSNKPFPEKLGVLGDKEGLGYANSIVLQEKALVAYKDWSEEAIDERRDEIRAWALERWRVYPVEGSQPGGEEALMRRVLTRIRVPRGQRQFFQSLYLAGEAGLSATALARQMGRRPDQLAGVLGALGHRINRTAARSDGQVVGINLLVQREWRDGEWHYRLKPAFRAVLESGDAAHLGIIA